LVYENEIWNKVVQGDKIALENIFHHNYHCLLKYGDKISKDKNITQDAVQEVFLNILLYHSKLSNVKNVKSYLFKSLRLEIWRRLKYDDKILNFENLPFEPQFSFEEKKIEDEILKIRIKEIAESLNDLPERQREAIYLRFYEGMTFDEISGIMSIEKSSSYKIIYKGLKKLYEKLNLKSGKLFYFYLYLVITNINLPI